MRKEETLEEIKKVLIGPLASEKVAESRDSPFKMKEQQVQELEERYFEAIKKSAEMSINAGKEILTDPEIAIKLPKDAEERMEEHRKSMLPVYEALDSNKQPPDMPPTLQEKLEISEESMRKIYEKTYTLYEQGNFEKAFHYCIFAINLSRFSFSFWSMLAICQEHMGDFAGASEAYIMAAMLEPQNWKMHVGAIRNWIKCDKKADAEEYAQKAINILEQNGKQKDVESLKACLKILKVDL